MLPIQELCGPGGYWPADTESQQYFYLCNMQDEINNPVFKVTDGQKQMLMKSEEDILNGDTISDDELNADEDQWLNG